MSSSPRTTSAIISPTVDAVCSGGLSLVVSVIVILYSLITDTGVSTMLVAIQLYLLTDLLINWPHFMASYRLLYGRPKNFSKHPIVTIVMPIVALIFLGYVIYRCNTVEGDQEPSIAIIGGLEWAAPVFLGWHYTGQAWGMTACFSFLSGFRMAPKERRLIRSGFYALFVYHVAWVYDSMGFVEQLFPAEEAGRYLMQAVMSACRAAAFAGFVAGLWGFRLLARREGKNIPARVWLPWMATFSWYVMVDVHPAAFFLLQIFHALQYLTFPVRVELNEFTRTGRRWRHLMFYYLMLVAFGFLAFDGSRLFGELRDSQLPIVTATIIILNLHHYFIDAVIWKIRDPEVRKSLFGHLAPASG